MMASTFVAYDGRVRLNPRLGYRRTMIRMPTLLCLQASITDDFLLDHVVAHRFLTGWFAHRHVARSTGSAKYSNSGWSVGNGGVGHESVLATFSEAAPLLVETPTTGVCTNPKRRLICKCGSTSASVHHAGNPPINLQHAALGLN